MTGNAAGRGWRWLVPVTVAGAALLMATSAKTAGGTDLQASRSLGLDSAVRAEQQRLATLTQQEAALAKQVAAETAAAAASNSGVATAQARAARLAPAAGFTAVTGPGVEVALDDASKAAVAADEAAHVDPDALVIHQQDVQAVVNALWAGGATAMTVMGKRLVATSAVRCVGNTLLLDGQVFSPPYVVTAVGPVAGLAAALETSPDVQVFRQYVAAYGLGYRQVTLVHVTLPPYSSAPGLTHAQPVGTP